MKKINFEKLEDNELFGSFQANKLSSLATANMRGGDSSTSLCLTSTSDGDTDTQDWQEVLADPRC